MKIGKVTCWILRMSYTVPLIDKVQHRWGNFVEIETDDGLKGYALASTSTRYGVRDFINKEVAPAIVGMDASRPEQIRNVLVWETAKAFTGAWSHAVSLIDIALWDIKGKALGSPIWRLLGGSEKKLPAYITFGFPWLDDDLLVAMAKKFVADGQKRLKMTVGSTLASAHEGRIPPTHESNAKDARRVRLVREAVGPDIELMVDGNKSLDFVQGLQLARMLEPYNLTWFEDPLLQGDPRTMARLRRETRVPIAGGSTGTGDIMYLREYFMLEALDYAQPNVRDIGGYTQGVKAAALAKAFNVPLGMGGNYPHFNMHLFGGVAQNVRIEMHLQGWQCTSALFDDTAQPLPDGTVELSDRPGLGFTPKSGILDIATKD